MVNPGGCYRCLWGILRSAILIASMDTWSATIRGRYASPFHTLEDLLFAFFASLSVWFMFSVLWDLAGFLGNHSAGHSLAGTAVAACTVLLGHLALSASPTVYTELLFFSSPLCILCILLLILSVRGGYMLFQRLSGIDGLLRPPIPLAFLLTLGLTWLIQITMGSSWLLLIATAPLLLMLSKWTGRFLDAVYALLIILSFPLSFLLLQPLLETPKQASTSGNDGGVVLITIDTLRRDALGIYGGQDGVSPILDNLAADAIIFDQAISPSPWTLPAAASLLTGFPPAIHGALERNSALPDSISTIAAAAKSRGIPTGAVVCNPFLGRAQGFDRGFDTFAHLPISAHRYPFGEWIWRMAMHRPNSMKGDGEQVVGAARRWLTSVSNGPFFLWIHLLDPHAPYTAHSISLKRRLAQPGMGGLSSNLMVTIRRGSKTFTDEEERLFRDLYLGEVTYVDSLIGEIVSLLRTQNRYENTMIIVTTDHGEEFWDHGGYEHGHTLYDELIHVPLLVKPQGSIGSRRISDLVSTASVAATALKALGGSGDVHSAPALQPYWQIPAGHEKPEIPYVVSEGMLYFGPGRSVRTPEFKYVEWAGLDTTLLFLLKQDPKETRSVIVEDSMHHQRAESMLALYDALSMTRRSEPASTLREALEERQQDMLKLLGYTE